MCRPRPYPRCSSYARKALQEAAAKYSSTPNPTAADFDAFAEAKRTYDLTPAGINALRSAGKHDEAKQMESERKLLVAVGDATTSASHEQLEALSQHSHRKVRIAVAENPNTPTTVLEEFAERYEGDEELLAAVAANPRTSGEVLRWLAHEGRTVQYAVAANPNTPKKSVSRLVHEAADNADGDLLMMALAHPNVSRKVLKRALSYKADGVADRAADRLPVSVLAEVAHDDDPARAKVVADSISRRSRDELVDYLVSEGGNPEDFADLPDSWLIASLTERV